MKIYNVQNLNEQNAQIGGVIIDKQSYMYQLTINNPIEKGYTHDNIKSKIIDNFRTITYFCMADEMGATFHTHIFIVFTSRVRWSKIKRHFSDVHIESCKGSVSDNILYIKKEGKWLDDLKNDQKIDDSFEEFGTPPPDSKGKRSDLSELYRMIQDNMSNSEIIHSNQDYILQIDKLDKIRNTILIDKYKDTLRLNLEVVYIFGATGTGKTRYVMENSGYSNVYRVTDYIHPFDSYSCQPVICFDEFRSSINISNMLMYCDVYPVELQSRYSNKVACYSKVFIVSNWPLEKQYSEAQINDIDTWLAFLRRITKVLIFGKNGTQEFNTVKEYFDSLNGKGGESYEEGCADF